MKSDAHLIDEFAQWVKQFGRDSATSCAIGELQSLRIAFTAGRALGKREGMVEAAEIGAKLQVDDLGCPVDAKWVVIHAIDKAAEAL